MCLKHEVVAYITMNVVPMKYFLSGPIGEVLLVVNDSWIVENEIHMRRMKFWCKHKCLKFYYIDSFINKA